MKAYFFRFLSKFFKENIFVFTFLMSVSVPAVTWAETLTAEARMMQLGAENTALSQLVGIWDVTDTIWNSPTAKPIIVSKLIAERKMVGPFLQEVIHPDVGSPDVYFQRVDYMTFNRIEGRWNYVSMDARAPDGIMPAKSFDRGEPRKITFVFEPFAVAGSGMEVSGQLLRMNQVFTFGDADYNVKEQRFLMADGTGNAWTAHKYEYRRRK